MEKIKNIDFLRIFLIICIMVFHLLQKTHLGIYFPHASEQSLYGDKSVEMFFVLSGFFLLYTFNEKISLFEFLKKKFIRFMPVIIFIGICYFVLSCCTNMDFYKYDIIFDFLFLNNIGITLSSSNILGSWFVSVIVFVSLFYFYLIKYFDRKYTNIIIAIISYLSLVLLVNLTNGTLGGHIKIYNNFLNSGLLRGLSFMGIGYIICCIYNYLKPTFKDYKLTVLKFLLYSICEIYLFIFLINNLLFHKIAFSNKLILVFAFVVLFWLFLLNRGGLSSLCNSYLFSLLSKYTYSIFITHLFVYKVLSYSLWESSINKYLIAFLTLFIAIFFGIITYYLVEKPFYKILKNKWLTKQ